MKYRTTRKDTMNGNRDIVKLPYCEAQSLLNAIGEAEAYTAGVYGWNADIYRGTEPGQVIVTGYRPFGRECKLPREAVRQFDREAEAIKRDYRRPWEERRAELEELFRAFCEAI